MRLEFTVENVQMMKTAFAVFPKKQANKIIRQSLRKAIEPFQKEVKRTSPKDTGKLSKDVKIRASKAKKWRKYIAMWMMQGTKYPGTFPGGFLEYGTEYIKAKHYVERAYATKRSIMVQTLTDQIRTKIIDGMREAMS